jgi:hypothetical protein
MAADERVDQGILRRLAMGGWWIIRSVTVHLREDRFSSLRERSIRGVRTKCAESALTRQVLVRVWRFEEIEDRTI